MFSDNQQYPRHTFRLKPSKDLPRHVDQSYAAPASSIPSNLEQLVTGTHRYRYFRRPVVPMLEAVPPEV